MWVTVAILVIAGIAVLISRKRELIQKWTTWVLIAPVVGIPIWLGRGTTAALAAALAVVAVIEYARLVKLGKVDHRLALGAGCAVSACGLAASVAAESRADRRAGVCAALGVRRRRRKRWQAHHVHRVRIGVDLLVVGAPGDVWADAYLVCFAAAATDVAAWCGGKGLRRLGWARRPLSPLSPNKTVGGMVGAIIGAFVVLTLLGHDLGRAARRGRVRRCVRRPGRVDGEAAGPGQGCRRLAPGLRRSARPDRLAVTGPSAGVSPRMSRG